MLHALNNNKARLDRIIKGVAKQPREDLITSMLFGALDFMEPTSQVAALNALLGLNLDPASKMALWPRFRAGNRQVEPDIVIIDGRDLYIVEVKWGAHLGIGQLERQLYAVENWECRREQDWILLGKAPRQVRSLIVLGFEQHHTQQIAVCAENSLPVHQRTWQDVARDMWRLKLDTKDATAAWAQKVHQFLTNTPKARTMTGWSKLEIVEPGCLNYNPIQPLNLVPVLGATWEFSRKR